jgi:hypothetical protein
VRKEKSAIAAGETIVSERLQTARVLVSEDAAAQGTLPFRVLTLPERKPVRTKVEDNPPSVTMIYKVSQGEVIIKQYLQKFDMVRTGEHAKQGQVIQIVRNNIVVDISGDVDREILEDFARKLE